MIRYAHTHGLLLDEDYELLSGKECNAHFPSFRALGGVKAMNSQIAKKFISWK